MRKVNRRKFMKLAGTAVLAASMTSVLGACDGAPEEPSALLGIRKTVFEK